jgi:asparagine synthase (glutamine-hydrolysing)
MSVQFGRWNLDGQSVDPEYISRVRALLAPYAPDAMTVCVKGGFFILYGAFHTTSEARHECQPSISSAGTYLTWTGRLDNQSELIARTNPPFATNATDLVIISSLYEKGGTGALRQLTGDWSLSALHHYERRLVLAVDFLGSRPLYYFHCDRYVAWSSVLEPLVTLAGQSFALSEDYVAGWLYGFPSASLTPYSEIRAVPPGSFVEITRTAAKVQKHWDFRPRPLPSSFGDADYEEGFLHFFTQAVRRRLRSSGPVVSELSGGMDSSSIVCIADRVLAAEPALAPRLDTLSYLDDTEVDWNERPFVMAVEATRDRAGFHIDVNEPVAFIPRQDPMGFPFTPAMGMLPSRPEQEVSAYLQRSAVRVVLSGLGGDESTGGVPDGAAELGNLLVQRKPLAFMRQGVAWCLPARRPLVRLVGSVIADFFPEVALMRSLLRKRVPWIDKEFDSRHRRNPAYAPLRLRINGPLPSVQENLYTLENLRRQIACEPISSSPPRERRYPFLDRDLLEFLYNAPREQIVRPGRRRSLMRRALLGIVPEVVLERKRKAYVSRSGIKSFQGQAGEIMTWTKSMHCSDFGVIDLHAFQHALAAASQSDASQLWQLSRTLALESWFRHERVQQALRLPHQRPLAHPQKNSNAPSPSGSMTSPQLGIPE